MAISFLGKIESQYYSPALLKMTQETERLFEEPSSGVVESCKNGLSRYLSAIIDKQENGYLPDIGYINISFLYSSLYFGAPVFQLDCYGEGWIMESDSLFTDALDASWFTQYLPDFHQDIQAGVIQEKASRFVHPEQIQVFSFRAIRSMLHYFSGILKYRISEIVDQQILAKIAKTERFGITFGEYLDWQKMLYAVQPEIDIFNCDAKESLRFRTFHAIYYKQKTFDKLILNGSIFKDCTFLDSKVSECIWNDCLFENCIFEHMEFADSGFLGATFVNCEFHSCSFEKILFSACNLDASEQTEFFKVVQFYRCALSNVKFENCDLTGCSLKVCETEAVEIEGGELSESSFIAIKDKTTDFQEGVV